MVVLRFEALNVTTRKELEYHRYRAEGRRRIISQAVELSLVICVSGLCQQCIMVRVKLLHVFLHLTRFLAPPLNIEPTKPQTNGPDPISSPESIS